MSRLSAQVRLIVPESMMLDIRIELPIGMARLIKDQISSGETTRYEVNKLLNVFAEVINLAMKSYNVDQDLKVDP